MVHCFIRGDDAAFDMFTCTDTDPSHSVTGAHVVDLTYGAEPVPGCAPHASKRAGCTFGSDQDCESDTDSCGTMSPQDRVACKAKAATTGFDPAACEATGNDYPVPSSLTCSAPVVGSFNWKMSYAARQGCTPVGGVSTDMIQGMYCPASMQQGAPPKTDSAIGTLKGQRAWGDCYVPQTACAGGHAVEAAP